MSALQDQDEVSLISGIDKLPRMEKGNRQKYNKYIIQISFTNEYQTCEDVEKE